MMDAKYITYHNDEHDLEDIVVFSALQVHADVAKHLPGKLLGAGFIQFHPKTVFPVTDVYGKVEIVCFGESISLKLKSRGEQDSLIADRMLLK